MGSAWPAGVARGTLSAITRNLVLEGGTMRWTRSGTAKAILDCACRPDALGRDEIAEKPQAGRGDRIIWGILYRAAGCL